MNESVVGIHTTELEARPGMHWSIADERRAEREAIPEDFRYVDPDDIEVRTRRPIWTWVARAMHEVPVGKCLLLPVPPGYGVERFMMNLRSSLSMARITMMDRFSVRRSKHEDYVVVMKAGHWKTLYQRMEEAYSKGEPNHPDHPVQR